MTTYLATVALGSADQETGRELHTFKILASSTDDAWDRALEELADEEGEVLAITRRR